MSSTPSPLSELDHDLPAAPESPSDAAGDLSTLSEAPEGAEGASDPDAPGKPQVARWYAVQVASSCE